MSRLVSRILLAILMLPAAGLVYTVTVVVMAEWLSSRYEIVGFATAGLVTWAFVSAYWWLLWRRSVEWTPARRTLMVAATGAAAVVGLVAGGATCPIEPGFGAFVGGVVAMLVWLAATVFVWRETPKERAGRLRSIGAKGVVCPQCGYNLTGLRTATCPECGMSWSIDELLAMQPGHEPEEMER